MLQENKACHKKVKHLQKVKHVARDEVFAGNKVRYEK